MFNKCYLTNGGGGEVTLVDRNYERIKTVEGVPVNPPSVMLNKDFDFIVVAARERFRESILSTLKEFGVSDEKIILSTFDTNVTMDAQVPTPTSPWGTFSYSYHVEDLCVLYTFKALGITKPTYMDVGANHPFSGSNTALMYKFGSRGINVEANPNLIEAFVKARPEDIHLNVGAGAKGGEMPFYVIDEDSGLSTFSQSQANIMVGEGHKITKILDIPVYTLDQIVEKYANGVYPDYLDIDVEGLDYEVLEACHFSDETPKVICCEVKDNHPLPEVCKMLGDKGYELYIVLSDDAIFLRNGLKQQLKITV